MADDYQYENPFARTFNGVQKGPFAEGNYQGVNTGRRDVQQSPYIAPDQQFRQGEVGLTGLLQQQANGQGPSLAGQMIQQAQDTNARNSMALAASTRARQNPGLALQAAQNQLGQSNQDAARAAAQARTQEILGARAQLAGVLGQGRQGDIAAAGMANQAGQFNAGQYNQQLAADVGAQNAFGMQQNQGIYGMSAQQQGSNLAARNMAFQKGLDAAGGLLNAPGAANPAAAGGAAAAAADGSDERIKKNIRPGNKPVEAFLDKLKAHEYRYKHPEVAGSSPGKHYSVMAQELERTGPVGKGMVDDTPNGKMVSYNRGLATMLAAQADLHQRVKRLEGRGE